METHICQCGSNYNSDDYNHHLLNDKTHILWLDSKFVKCECGVEYNYSNQHNHFKSSKHRVWQNGDISKYDNVKIICKCGEIIEYSNRSTHNKKQHTS